MYLVGCIIQKVFTYYLPISNILILQLKDWQREKLEMKLQQKYTKLKLKVLPMEIRKLK